MKRYPEQNLQATGKSPVVIWKISLQTKEMNNVKNKSGHFLESMARFLNCTLQNVANALIGRFNRKKKMGSIKQIKQNLVDQVPEQKLRIPSACSKAKGIYYEDAGLPQNHKYKTLPSWLPLNAKRLETNSVNMLSAPPPPPCKYLELQPCLPKDVFLQPLCLQRRRFTWSLLPGAIFPSKHLTGGVDG